MLCYIFHHSPGIRDELEIDEGSVKVGMAQPELHRVDRYALSEPMASCRMSERMRAYRGPDG